MKNIMVVDKSQDYFFDVHSVSDEDFLQIFPGNGQNIEFNDDLYARFDIENLNDVFHRMWHARIANKNAKGLHGILFYEDHDRKPFYKNKKDFSEKTNTTYTAKNDLKTVLIFDCNPEKPIVACLAAKRLFDKIFFQPEQDVEFLEDLEQRLGIDAAAKLIRSLLERTVRKSDISGIDGVIYIESQEKKKYFVTKIDADIPRHYPLSD